MCKSPRLVRVGLGLLLLVSAVLSSACPGARGDDDRPVIIITSGSVTVDVTPGSWTRESGGGKKYRQKDANGRSVRSFSASTGGCTVAGEKLVVTYGASTLTLERQRSGLFGKRDSVVQFPDAATVTETSAGILTVTTDDALVRVTNGGAGSCDVVDKKVTIRQVH